MFVDNGPDGAIECILLVIKEDRRSESSVFIKTEEWVVDSIRFHRPAVGQGRFGIRIAPCKSDNGTNRLVLEDNRAIEIKT